MFVFCRFHFYLFIYFYFLSLVCILVFPIAKGNSLKNTFWIKKRNVTLRNNVGYITKLQGAGECFLFRNNVSRGSLEGPAVLNARFSRKLNDFLRSWTGWIYRKSHYSFLSHVYLILQLFSSTWIVAVIW